MQQFHKFFLLDVYVWLNMFRALPRPSSGAYNCISSLWFYRWSVMVGALLVVVWPVTGQTTTNNAEMLVVVWPVTGQTTTNNAETPGWPESRLPARPRPTTLRRRAGRNPGYRPDHDQQL